MIPEFADPERERDGEVREGAAREVEVPERTPPLGVLAVVAPVRPRRTTTASEPVRVDSKRLHPASLRVVVRVVVLGRTPARALG